MRPLAILLSAGTLLAAPPVLQDLSPHGGQRGKSFTLYMRGDALPQNARVETTLPASFSRLTLSKDPASPSGRVMRPDSVLPFLVSLRADAPVGLYPIRVITDSGISNVLLFSVGDLPEIEKAKEGDTQKVAPPVLINAKLAGPEIHNYTFHAAAGQKLVFEVEARRAGSAIDPAIEIFDAAGREIARNDDAPSLGVDSRIEVTFPKTGDYRVAVHDSKYSDQGQNFYRLKIAKFDYADTLFPLGGPKGTDVTLSGGNLAKPIHVKAESPWISVPGSFALPLAFALTDKPEVMAPVETLPEGQVVNGRIAQAGAIDHYRVKVEPGQKWVFEINAATLGTSRLDAIITAYDTNGKKLASADDGNGFDPVLPFTVPDKVHEVMLAVEDLLGRGGEQYGYRLEAKQQHPDFVASMITPFVNVPAGGTARVSVLIQRRGYAGEMRVTIPNLPAGFKVAGGHVPVEAAQQDYREAIPGRKAAVASLTITAPADAKPQSLDLQVLVEAHTEDGVIRRYAGGPGIITAVRGDKQKPFTAPWLGMRLPMAITDPPPITIAAVTPLAHFAQGFEFELKYEVTRTSAAKAPVRVNTTTLGAVGNLRILKGTGKNGDKGSFLLDTNFATPFALFDMAYDLSTEIDGKPVVISSPIMEIEVAPGYQVKLARNQIDLAPGGSIEIPGTIYREPTFEGGLVKLRAEDLPEHVTCAPVEVAATDQNFKLSCTAEAGARAGSFPIRISSVAPDTGKKAKADYKIPDLTATLQVGKSRLASK